MNTDHLKPEGAAGFIEPTFDPSGAIEALGIPIETLGVVIVDHGSQRDESNQMLVEVVMRFRQSTGWPIVEPAHMELAEPSIDTAIRRAVAQGAEFLVVHPYFLAPGRHWRHDIPRLVAQAATHHAGLRYLITAPLGLHPMLQRVIEDRIVHCLQRSAQQAPSCDVCQHEVGCQRMPELSE
jgi:sirohydrochlorin ferrochelatase